MNVLLVMCVVLLLIYFYAKLLKKLSYWTRKKVPNFEPIHPAGDFLPSFMGLINQHVLIWNYYNEFKEQNVPFGGLYFTIGPIFLPIDLGLIKRILEADFEHFSERGVFHDQSKCPLSENLFSRDFHSWKRIRTKLSSLFTRDKLKSNFSLVLNCSHQLIDVIGINSLEPINVLELFTNYGVDVYLTYLLGLPGPHMHKENSIHKFIASKFSDQSAMDVLKVAMSEGSRNPGNFYKMLVQDSSLLDLLDVLVGKALRHKLENNMNKNNLIDQLLDLMQNDEEEFKYEDFIAEVMTLYMGSLDTTAISLSCCFYELASNKEILKKLMSEIDRVLGTDKSAKLSFEHLPRMRYLDQIIMETFRKYPPVPVINRYCVKDYKVPGTEVVIEKGTPVVISVLGIHYDEVYYPDAECFDPNRFQGGSNASYMFAFGQGPRSCIAKLLGELQMKVAVVDILRNFDIKLNPRTGPKLNVDNVTKQLVLHYRNTIWIDFKKKNNKYYSSTST